MDISTPPRPISPLPHLPPELWLQILTFLPTTTLWLTLRPVHPFFLREIESHFCRTHLPNFTLSHTFSLASGIRHRWYDVRATVTLSYACRGSVDASRTLFAVKAFVPPNYQERAGEKWRGLCAAGTLERGRGSEWQVEFAGQTGVVELNAVVADEAREGAVWVDWREVVCRWMRRMEMREEGLALEGQE